MTDRDALIARIAGAIARKTAAHAPAAVLDELETTHVLVDRKRAESIYLSAVALLDAIQREPQRTHVAMSRETLTAAQHLGKIVMAFAGDLDPIGHGAAESDTSVPQNVADCHTSVRGTVSLCDRCSTPASHSWLKGNEQGRLCCACHVADGGAPADWHTGCMAAYRALHPSTAEA